MENMIQAVISDFSKVLLFAKDTDYTGGLNDLYDSLFLLRGGDGIKFFDYFTLNEELLDYYRKVNENTPVYIFTSDKVQKDPVLSEILQKSVTDVYSAFDLGVHKSECAAYRKVLDTIEISANEGIFIDDKISNLERAGEVGLRTHQHLDNAGTIKFVEDVIVFDKK